MRLKRSRLRRFHHRPAVPKKDGEGSSHIEYGPSVPFQAEEWPAGGKVQAELYGMRLPNVRNLRLQGEYREISIFPGRVSYAIDGGPTISANDGICLYADEESEPDYKVAAIYPYGFLTLEVEKL